MRLLWPEGLPRRDRPNLGVNHARGGSERSGVADGCPVMFQEVQKVVESQSEVGYHDGGWDAGPACLAQKLKEGTPSNNWWAQQLPDLLYKKAS